MSTVTLKPGERRAAAVSGLVNTTSGIGGSALSPVISMQLISYGLTGTAVILSLPLLSLLSVSYALASPITRSQA